MSLKLHFEPNEGKWLGAQAVGGGGVDKRIDVRATFCQVGQRAYIATRILRPAGFSTENVSGGCKTFQLWRPGSVAAPRTPEAKGSRSALARRAVVIESTPDAMVLNPIRL